MIVGCVVGDEEIYDVFVDLFDLVIEGCYNGYSKDVFYKIDLNFDNFIGGEDLDEEFVFFCWVRIGCSIWGLILLFYCICVE